ncbi:ABC transporter permease [Marivibrio halodurans]|uniref:ABC transporter permease n=1 Tax=Marivibrio halodurans TaxID=2039722 RepID=A0A8J7SNE2_9PROT|nr:FtsX-like permease family protein [Marivibrio halodurans]MBP5857958.1 ABC transporter permease [Marivibrio halodurans]
MTTNDTSRPATLPLAWRIARRELRGGLKGFRVFLACLALGVAAIAGVGSVASSIEDGLRRDAKTLLGGDVDLRLTHQTASDAQLTWLDDNTEAIGRTVRMRAMAILPDGSDRRLVELKAVDGAYPLYGAVALEGGGDIQEALNPVDGVPGAAVAPQLARRFDIAVGDRFRVGEQTFHLAAIIAQEPDGGTQAFNLGPRVMIAYDDLPATGLVQPGSLIRYHYRVRLAPEQAVGDWIAALKERFPDAGWRIQALDNAAPNIQRFVDRVGLFLTLVGLTALLVGGVGVGNAVRAFLNQRTGTIATLKCLGAPARTIFSVYLMQVGVLALAGIAIGLVIGAGAPMVAGPLIADRLPVEARLGFYPEPLLIAVGFGLLVTLVFSLWPLAKACGVPAATLFRDVLTPVTGRPGPRTLVAIAIGGAGLAGLALLTADDPRVAAGFVAGAAATLVAFRLAAWAVMRAAAKAPRPKGIRLGLALANLHRPGAPTGSVVVSLGLGLTVLAAVALIEANLNRQVNETLKGEAPGYYFIDIQPDQIEPFLELTRGFDGVRDVETVPMLRGRITAMDGTPVEAIDPPPEEAWILRGDRGITWARTPPNQGSEVVEGDWWPADYDGPPLVSFDVEAARAFGLAPGDTLTVNVLGREIQAEIANLRAIDWTSLGINFVMVFSPGMMERAPQSYIATAYLPPDRETELEAAVVDRFPNVSAIRVKEVLESVNEILGNLGIAVRAIAGVAILAGILVLAGALAAGHERRIYDSVVLKVLGATRRDVIAAFSMEYGLMGLITALIAGTVGAGAAYVVVSRIMGAEWIFVPEALGATVLLAVAVTIGCGLIGTWIALGRKAAPLLRNE